MTDSQSRYAVFLSHDGRDKDLIESIAHKLRDSGLLPWFDKWELIPGNRWIGGLAEGINASNTCAVFIGPRNLGNWEAEEIDLAHTRAAKDPSFRVFPVLLPGVPDPLDENTLPPFVKTRTWVDFRKGLDDPRAFHSLLCGIRGIAPRPKSVSISAADHGGAQDVCPYRGLQVFNEEDARFYFGREADVLRLLEKLKATRLIGVLGASGSGKSSLARAGLIPALRAGALPGSELWQIVRTFTPGSAPLEALVLSLAKLPGGDVTGLHALLHDSERALHAAVRDFLDLPAQRNAGTQRVLLLIDQLEEIFTLSDKETDRSQFLANLLYAGSVPNGGCVIVITLRADFYQKCAVYPEFSAALAAHQLLVGGMPRDGLLQAIQEPARVVGLEFEPGLVEMIADDVSSQPGTLPLLEHALLELWKRRQAGVLSLEAYLDTGRVQGAIAKRADAIYGALNAHEQLTMKRIMLRLTQPGEGTEDTRRPATLDELITRPEDEETVERVVDTLTKPEHRLLAADEKFGARTIEVSHEALIRGWERLRKWLDEDREGLRLHRRISEAAKEWKEQTLVGISDEGLLYRGLPLARALEWRKQHDADLNELEREFLNESETCKQRVEDEERARQQRDLETARRLAAATQAQAISERKSRVRQRYYTIGLAVLVVVTSALFFYAYRQYKDSRAREIDSRSREIARKSTDVLQADPHLSVLLATEAVRIRDTPQAQAALREALVASYGVKQVLHGHVGSINDAVFSPDGKWVVTASDDKTARVWEAATGQTVSELKGHSDEIDSAAFSPDGKWVATASNDKTARVWEAATGRLVMQLTGHESAVNSAVFSPDGKWVLTSSSDNKARVWEAMSGRTVSELDGHTDLLLDAVFSPDGKWAATGGSDNTARLWEAATGRMVHELRGHTDAVNRVVFSPDGKMVLTVSEDKTARVWDVATGRMLRELKGHTDNIFSGDFSRDNKLVLTASYDKSARVWDVATGRMLQELSGHTDVVFTAISSPDSKRVVTASSDNTARVWDVATGETIVELKGHAAAVIQAAFSPDGKSVVTASFDKTARVWDVATERTAQRLEDHAGSLRNAVFSPDGKWVLTSGSDNTARVWEAGTGRMAYELNGHTDKVVSAVFSPDGKLIVTASADDTARVWEAATGRMIQELKGHTWDVHSAVFSPDGKWVITASRDRTARVWDVATGHTVQELIGHTFSISSAIFSPDGKSVATAGWDKTARVWEIATGRMLQELKGHTNYVDSAVFSPDGKWIVTASWDDTARVWEAATGRTVHELKGLRGVQGAVFSPDSKWVLTVSSDQMARLWDVATGRTVRELKGHTGLVTSGAFSVDGKWVVTASWDSTARVWDAATGLTVQELKGHTANVESAVFSPDGRRVLTASQDQTARIFDCEELGDLESLLALAKRRVQRQLSAEERNLYLN